VPEATSPATTLAGCEVVPFTALDRDHARIRGKLRACFDDVLRRGSFVLGEDVERFEAAWARASGCEHCVGVGSGTAALTLLLWAAGVGPGDEVIVPAHTFAATALAVVATGADPVLCDVEDGTGLLDLDSAATVVGPRTAAILPVHLYGQMCDMPAVSRFARAHGLLVVEDAAQAHGARCEGFPPGTSTSGAAYSFYPSKNLGALGDGGAVCTNDAMLAERVRRLRNLGRVGKGEHLVPGLNERLDALQAAVLLIKLPDLDRANQLRRAHARRYHSLLGVALRTLEERQHTPCVYHLFPVRVPERDAVAARLRAAGIEVGVHYTPALHAQPALRRAAILRTELPNAEAWAAEELSLPMSPLLEPHEVQRAAETCLTAVTEQRDG
jgi:dTDP-3-amino-3,4,6-trideoxy-alpha-D-glucose transaminase